MDEVSPLRARLERGDWRALLAPGAEGLLACALLVDPTWWRPAWIACLAELLRPWWPRDPRGDEYRRDRARWRIDLAPAYYLREVQRAHLQHAAPDIQGALAVLARWPAGCDPP